MQIYNQFDTHAFVKMFVNAKTDEERGEILANTISQTRQENVTIVEKQLRKTTSQLEAKQNIDTIEARKEMRAIQKDIIELRKEVDIMQKDIIELRKEVKEIELKIAQLEIRMTNKLYIVVGGLAVFLTTIILGVLPFVLKAS